MSIDKLLSSLGNQVKFEEEPKKERTTIVEKKAEPDFDVTSFLDTKFSGKTLLEQLKPTITEEDKNVFRTNSGTSNNEDFEKIIRKVLKEEIEHFFSKKTLLNESDSAETIYLKIGNSVFKGTLVLVE